MLVNQRFAWDGLQLTGLTVKKPDALHAVITNLRLGAAAASDRKSASAASVLSGEHHPLVANGLRATIGLRGGIDAAQALYDAAP